jgi:hypothetical protein
MEKCNPQVIFALGVICFMRLKTLVSNQPRCEHLSSWRTHDVVCMDSKVQQTIGVDSKVWHIERRNKVQVTKELVVYKIWYASIAKHYNKMCPMFIMWFHWILSDFTRFDWTRTMDSLGHWTRINELHPHFVIMKNHNIWAPTMYKFRLDIFSPSTSKLCNWCINCARYQICHVPQQTLATSIL